MGLTEAGALDPTRDSMGQRHSHPELTEEAPAAQNLRGILNKYNGDACRQYYAVLVSRKLHLFTSEQAALDWSTPSAVVSLANCAVHIVEESFQSSLYPAGTFVIETPPDADRLEVQNGQTSLYFRAVGDSASGDPGTEEWMRKLRIASRERWEDNSAHECPRCNSAFDVFNRRHHCRRCGKICCEPCSSFYKEMPEAAYTEPVRVCRVCFEEHGPVLSEAQAGARTAALKQATESLRKTARDSRREEGAEERAASSASGASSKTYGLGVAY